MGMFDSIQCHARLPVQTQDDCRDHWYQTKSLDCELKRYRITEDGELMRQDADEDDWDSNDWKPMPNFIGEVVFYGEPETTSNPTRWLDFSAYFVNGKMKEFHVLNDYVD